MTNRDDRDGLQLEIGSIALPASYDATNLAARIERAIADRRLGPGGDPVVTAIAARVLAALDTVEEVP